MLRLVSPHSYPVSPHTLCTKIANGQRELARIRGRVGWALLGMGVTLGAMYEALHCVVNQRATDEFWSSPMGYVYSVVSGILFYGRFVVVSLAPVAHDPRITRLAMLVDAMILIIADLVDIFVIEGWSETEVLSVAAYVIADALFLPGILWAAACSGADDVQRWLWMLLAGWVVLYMPTTIWLAVQYSRECDCFSDQWLWVCIQAVALSLILRPSWQDRLRRTLMMRFEARSTQCAAASVAGLVGNCTAKEVLAQASERFRCVRLEDVEFQDMADNVPNPALWAKTESCRLRSCDAFVSHSWHDDAGAKWDAMQRWRAEFVRRHGREPRVWIDKCCIDQRSIEEDLRCLPIFLSGCRRMVVFCGPSYLSRLWCIVELFTFVHMGGKVDNIRFEPVCRQGCEEEDMEEIHKSFERFDAEDCTCFLPEDKRRLLDVIIAGFGDIKRFNADVRDIFEASRWEAMTMVQCATSNESSCASSSSFYVSVRTSYFSSVTFFRTNSRDSDEYDGDATSAASSDTDEDGSETRRCATMGKSRSTSTAADHSSDGSTGAPGLCDGGLAAWCHQWLGGGRGRTRFAS